MFLFLLLNYYILVFYQFNDLQNVFNYSQNKKKIRIQFLHLAFKQITVNKNERVKKYEKRKYKNKMMKELIVSPVKLKVLGFNEFFLI